MVRKVALKVRLDFRTFDVCFEVVSGGGRPTINDLLSPTGESNTVYEIALLLGQGNNPKRTSSKSGKHPRLSF